MSFIKYLAFILGLLVSFSVYSIYQENQTPESILGGGSGTINQLQQFVVAAGGIVKLASSTADIRVPSLQNCDTIDTDGNGVFECGTDASGGGGGGSISTSTVPVAGKLAYWTSASALSDVASGTLTETASGLEFSATRGLVGGASVLSLTSGFNIPLTASTSNWNTFYDTPSNRITAGTGIDWSSNTLNGVYTAGDGITLNTEDFDCDTASGSVFGCLTAANWTSFNGKVSSSSIDTSAELLALVTDETGTGALVFADTPTLVTPVLGVASATSLDTGFGANELYDMDQHMLTTSNVTFAHSTSTTQAITGLTSALVQTGPTGITAEYGGSGTCTNQFMTVLSVLGIATCASVTTASITDGTIIEPDLDADNSPNDTDYLQYDSTGANFIWRSIANVVADLEADIETALDTLTSLVTVAISTTLTIPFGTTCDSNADGEICQDTSGNQIIVDGLAIATQDIEIWSVTVASTSPAFISSGLLAVPTRIDGYTITRIQCHVLGGTSKIIAVEDASANSSEDITCATTNTTDDGTITNATYTASELSYIDFGATSGSVNTVSISAFGNWTRE